MKKREIEVEIEMEVPHKGKKMHKCKMCGHETKMQRNKVAKVMHEYKEGKLPIGKSKKMVHNPKQALAIALSESGLSKKRKSKKKD